MSSGPVLIESENLSLAWAAAFEKAVAAPRGEITPLTVVVTRDAKETPLEDMEVRTALDAQLAQDGKFSVETVASTIFPRSMWKPGHGRAELYDRYLRTWPRISKHRNNRNGTYFQRMISYGEPIEGEEAKITARRNQLEHIIQTYRTGNHRRSALQLAIFDPTKDHNNQPRCGFPCLQQVGFAHLGGVSLGVIGFYPLQNLYEKAYGNYLGLWRLGEFVAYEVGLTLTRMTCVAGVAQHSEYAKGAVRALAVLCAGAVSAAGDRVSLSGSGI